MCRQKHMQLTSSLSNAQRGFLTEKSRAQLTSARILVRRKIDRCAIALFPGPIRHLPPEILGEIFWHCLWPFQPPHPSSAPLLLCRVSCLWREITFNMSSLWNHLEFSPQWDHQLRGFLYRRVFSNGRDISPLDDWLAHSRPTQLNLCFREPNVGNIKELLSMVLLSHARAIKRLEIRLPWGVYKESLQPFSQLQPNSMCSLKYLIVTGRLPEDVLSTLFQSAQALTHLSITDIDFAVGVYRAGEVPTLKLLSSWGTLTHLVITRCIEPGEWVAVLSSCISLEVGAFAVDLRHGPARIHNDDGGEEEDNEDQVGHACGHCDIPAFKPVVLANLTDLEVDFACGKWLSMDHFHFPALSNVHIRRSHLLAAPTRAKQALVPLDDFSWRNSLAFLMRSTKIRTLSLEGDVGSVEEIVTLLQHVPLVDLLSLNINIDYMALLPELTLYETSTGGHLLPWLEHLRVRLGARDIPYISANMMRDMVLSRSTSTSCHTGLGQLTISVSSEEMIHFQNMYQEVEKACPNIRSEVEIEPCCSRIVLSARSVIPWGA